MKIYLLFILIILNSNSVKSQFRDSSFYFENIGNTKIIHADHMVGSCGYSYSKYELDSILTNDVALKIVVEINDDYSVLKLINNTKTDISVRVQDGSLPFIREALDSNGLWKPIEYWVYSDCGNSYYQETISSGTYLKIEFYSYFGEYKTKIRYKIKVNDEIMYSEVFDGFINYAQFKLPEKMSTFPSFDFLK